MRARKQAYRDQQRQDPQEKTGLVDRFGDCPERNTRVTHPEGSPVLRPTLLERIFGRKKDVVCEPQVYEHPVPMHVPVDEPKAHSKMPSESKTMLKADVELAKPGDSRQSWGKYEALDPIKPGRTGGMATSTKPESKYDDSSWTKPSPAKSGQSVEELDLPRARKSPGRDPLTSPGAFTPFAPDLPVTDPVQTPELPARKVSPSRSLLPPPPPMPAPGDTPSGRSSMAPRPGTKVPGSGSVLAAGDPQYVPVPIRTMPSPRPPVPPSASIPQPPQAPALNQMVNRAPNGGQPPPGMANAFTEPGPTRPIPSESIPADMAENAFSGPAPAAPGIPSPPNPAFSGYPPVPPSFAPMPPQTRPMQSYPTTPPNYVPASYYNYHMPPPSGMAPVGYAQPQQPASTMPSVGQMLQMLRESDFPSQREWAAEQLALNARSNPEVVQSLVLAARTDPAPMVRVCCVRSLVKMQANTVPVVTAVQELKHDTDPRVRDAVGEALTAFGVTPTTPGASPIQPVGGH
jgi:hypothetical protein